jgi:hypothetical protein
VLGVPIIRHNRRNPGGRRTLDGIEHNQKFHQVVVRRVARRLDHKYVGPAYVLLDQHPRLAVAVLIDKSRAKLHSQMVRYRLSKRRVRIAGKHPQFSHL